MTRINPRTRVLKLGRYKLFVSLAIAKGSKPMWFRNDKPSEYRVRRDLFISLERLYSRKDRTYAYVLVIGRYAIHWARL